MGPATNAWVIGTMAFGMGLLNYRDILPTRDVQVSRKSEVDNQIFEELATRFANEGMAGGLHIGASLRRDLLDYSLSSLAAVDAYLAIVHAQPGTDRQMLIVALRCGAYVGEVMRRNTGTGMQWRTFDRAAAISPLVKDLGKQPSTLGVLIHDTGGISFPLGKVIKFLTLGPHESVRVFVESLSYHDVA